MNLVGIVVGLFSFGIIGVFHPIVIKCEYYFSWRIWPAFLAGGVACLLAALLCTDFLIASLLGVLGFTCLWSIRELREQSQRVEKGWFPQNPKRGGRTAGKQVNL